MQPDRFRWEDPDASEQRVTLSFEHDVVLNGRTIPRDTKVRARLAAAGSAWVLTGETLEHGATSEPIVGLGGLADRLFATTSADATDDKVLERLVAILRENKIFVDDRGFVRDLPTDPARILLELLVVLHGHVSRSVAANIQRSHNTLLNTLGLHQRGPKPALTVLELTSDAGTSVGPDIEFAPPDKPDVAFRPVWSSVAWSCGRRFVDGRLPVVLPWVAESTTKQPLVLDLWLEHATSDQAEWARRQSWRIELGAVAPGEDGRRPGVEVACSKPTGPYPEHWLMTAHAGPNQWLRFSVPLLPPLESIPASWEEDWHASFSSAKAAEKSPPREGTRAWLSLDRSMGANFLTNGESPVVARAGCVIAINAVPPPTAPIESIWEPEAFTKNAGLAGNGIRPAAWGSPTPGRKANSLIETVGGDNDEPIAAYYERCALLLRTRGRPQSPRDWEATVVQLGRSHGVVDAFARPRYRRGATEVQLGVEILIRCKGEATEAYHSAAAIRAHLQDVLMKIAPVAIAVWVLVPKPVYGAVRVASRQQLALDPTVTARLEEDLLGLFGFEVARDTDPRSAGRLPSPHERSPLWTAVRQQFLAGWESSGRQAGRSVAQFAAQFMRDSLPAISAFSSENFNFTFIADGDVSASENELLLPASKPKRKAVNVL